DLGSALRRGRRRRKVSLERAARETRIGVRYLKALETGAPLDAFPAPMYARAFLREYARFLKLDPEPLLLLLTPYEPPPVAPTLAVLSGSAPRRSLPRGRIAALLAGVLLSVLLLLAGDDPLRTPRSIPAAVDQPVTAPVPVDTDVPRLGPPASALTADLRATGRTWLRVTVDDEVVFEGIAAAGWSRSFSGAERLRILIGNAGAVELAIDGDPLGRLGPVGSVRELLITLGSEGPVVRTLPRSA
ncbi:MAG: helix-turn-helix domain-containing protein, partial [Actinomycetota bacterium]